MVALLCFVLDVLTAPFKSKSRLEAKNATLRRHLRVLRRKVYGRVRLTNNETCGALQEACSRAGPLGAGTVPDDIVASYSIEIFASRPTLIQRCVSLRIKSPNC